ncbi:MAG: site-specific integrase [Pseudomonadota bacterium]
MTKRPNEKNERLKRQFLEFRKHADQLSEASLDREIAALERFDVWNERTDFARFNVKQAMDFRAHLESAKGASGKPLGKSTMKAILTVLRAFFAWLSQQDGFRSRIRTADANYFNLSRRDEAEARNAPPRPAPGIKQAKKALALMPDQTPRERRDKAIFALLCLTGIRVTALTTLRIKHVDLDEKSVVQNPREVRTKFGKHIDTFFVKGFDEAEGALEAWMAYLEDELHYGPDDPLFPVTSVSANANTGFEADGFERRHWGSAGPVRQIVRSAFENAGLESFGTHAFRHMLARHAVKTSESVAELVANSQNLGHTDVLTTLRSYGQLDRDRQRQLVTGLDESE